MVKITLKRLLMVGVWLYILFGLFVQANTYYPQFIINLIPSYYQDKVLMEAFFTNHAILWTKITINIIIAFCFGLIMRS